MRLARDLAIDVAQHEIKAGRNMMTSEPQPHPRGAARPSSRFTQVNDEGGL